jgi:nitrogen regulatory protein P-II 1
MKKIEAIVRPERVGLVRKALEEIGYGGMTITEVKGHGVQRGVTQQWRGNTYRVDILPKVKLEIVAKDAEADKIVAAICEHGRTGEIGDGKIFISTVDDAIRVRTGEHGEAVL